LQRLKKLKKQPSKKLTKKICRFYFSDGSSTTETTGYSYFQADAYFPNIRGVELLLDAQTTSYSDGNTVRTKYHYPFQPTTQAVLAVHDASARTYLNANGYRQPVASETFVNGIRIEANVTALTLEDNKIAPKANYGLQNGNFVLLGKFDGYNSDAKPARYILAKFGANNASASSEFFEPIHLEWDNRLHLTSRRYLDFLTTNQFSGFFEYAGTTDNNGVKTEIAYDTRGRVASVSKLNGHKKTSYEYLIGPGANAIKMNTHYRTGEDMNLMQYLDGLGKETKLFRLNDGARLNEKTYDSFWRVKMEYNIGSEYTEFEYENSPLSKLLLVEDAVNNVVTHRYFGQPEADTYTGTAVTDPNGHTSTSHYNSLGKLRKTVAGISANVPDDQRAVVTYAYDNLQRLTTITNPIGEKFLYEYNNMGLVWRTTVPGRNPQSTWYDHKFRPVATQDGNGKLIINQYDSQDRLWKSFLHETGSVSGEGINNSDLSSLFDNTKRLSELTYTAPGSTWVQESYNRLLRQMPETATPYMVRSVHGLDDIGRATQSTVTYPDASLTQNTVYSSAGFVKRSTRQVQHNVSGAGPLIIDIFSHDNVLRPEKHRIQYGPDEHNDFVMANHLVYDEHDRLIKKFVGGAPGNENQFLQEVNYAYDAISRLLRINDPGTFGCNIGEEVCELSLELKLPKTTLAAGHCRRLEAIKVDNLTYTLPAPLDLTAVGQAPVITAAIQQALDLFGLDGTANLVDIRNDADYFYFSTVVTGTQAGSMSWVLQSCDQSPAYSSDCCIIAPPSVPPAVQNNGLPFSNCADLYHQRMRYNGLDIANITLGSSCDARLVNNYSYDALHRITAMHNTLQRPGLPAEDAYSTSYSYDRAGNIQRLSRRGFVGMSGNTPVYDLIDDLHYSYAPGANPVLNAFSSKLQGVDDMVTNTAAQPHGVFLESSGYGYDDNGNMISAGSVSAEYNILNLPTVLSTSSGDRKFEYVYGAGKYSAQLITGNPAINETRHYLGGMEYKDGVLEAYNFGDGRIVWENSVPKFQYRLHDHLGNTVVFFEDKNNNGCITTEEEATSPADLEIIQRLLYYPFGMALEGLGAWNAEPWQQYRYNGKERDTLTGWYEYGFRWYIDGIGRFTGVDPIADRFAWVSVYNYAENEPVGHIDLHGLQKAKVDLKPTVITMQYDYQLRTSNIPFVESYRSVTGTFTELTSLSVTDISLGDEGGGYIVNVRIPRVYAHNRDNPSYTTQSYTGKDFDNLEAVHNTNLVGAFFDGMRIGITTALAEEAFNAGAFSKYKVPSNFKVQAAEKSGGIRFVDPRNPRNNEIRMMKGNPRSAHASQHNAYVKFKHNGTFYDVNGQPIKSAAGGARSPEAHIPLNKYNPSLMPKFD